jgi:glycerol-3-phosphate acyltransferase PlsY
MPKEMFLILASYALGCISVGYYLVRLYTGEDIRGGGSGSAGATNVGRRLGPWGFSVTLLLDAAKGAAAAGAASYFGLESWGVMLAILAVVAGHIWPLQLEFRGGKGIAPAFGGILVFDYQLGIITISLCGTIFVFVRQLTLSGLLVVILSPGVAFLLGHSDKVMLEMLALALLILVSHRKNIRALAAGTHRQAVG